MVSTQFLLRGDTGFSSNISTLPCRKKRNSFFHFFLLAGCKNGKTSWVVLISFRFILWWLLSTISVNKPVFTCLPGCLLCDTSVHTTSRLCVSLSTVPSSKKRNLNFTDFVFEVRMFGVWATEGTQSVSCTTKSTVSMQRPTCAIWKQEGKIWFFGRGKKSSALWRSTVYWQKKKHGESGKRKSSTDRYIFPEYTHKVQLKHISTLGFVFYRCTRWKQTTELNIDDTATKTVLLNVCAPVLRIETPFFGVDTHDDRSVFSEKTQILPRATEKQTHGVSRCRSCENSMADLGGFKRQLSRIRNPVFPNLSS